MLDKFLGENPEARRIQHEVARALFRLGIGANVATALAAVIGVGAGIALCAGATGWGILLLAASAMLDAVDGTIAREFAAPSAIGGVFDLVSDRIVETAVIVGIAWYRPELFRPALLLVGSWYVNITVFLAVGAALERKGPKLIDYPPGILERTEALIFFAVLALVASVGILRGLGPILCYAMTALEVATGLQRLMFGYQMLRAADAPAPPPL
jgi:archaetidylinositol phosphate synthase